LRKVGKDFSIEKSFQILRNRKIINAVFDGLFFRHFSQKIPIAIGTRNKGYAILPDGQTGIFFEKTDKKIPSSKICIY